MPWFKTKGMMSPCPFGTERRAREGEFPSNGLGQSEELGAVC